MKIKVESDKIIKAVRKLSGIEVVLESADDAKEAIHIVLSKAGLAQKTRYPKLKEVKVTSFQEYKTSAVDYRMVFLLEFVFEENAPWRTRAPPSRRSRTSSRRSDQPVAETLTDSGGAAHLPDGIFRFPWTKLPPPRPSSLPPSKCLKSCRNLSLFAGIIRAKNSCANLAAQDPGARSRDETKTLDSVCQEKGRLTVGKELRRAGKPYERQRHQDPRRSAPTFMSSWRRSWMKRTRLTTCSSRRSCFACSGVQKRPSCGRVPVGPEKDVFFSALLGECPSPGPPRRNGPRSR